MYSNTPNTLFKNKSSYKNKLNSQFYHQLHKNLRTRLEVVHVKVSNVCILKQYFNEERIDDHLPYDVARLRHESGSRQPPTCWNKQNTNQ